ncbi:PTS sugar transporter subunit IIB [Peptostreptococcus russellii]|uniref:PTS sugar transporter subunit IIB n=1 Tax=Peptostreptococcus russellii TaxID=215200 RepID=UPI00162A7007|nr:PTS sugar transporter subunit IIB [Peptostreptococcus russellii]MBC2576929.1 PTS sugar transporter subunit IIB [Peptostreptococcus russellii]
MKFLTICGSGLGSSFMVQMNIEKVLKELGVTGVTVEHSDVSSAVDGAADVFFMAKDVAEGVNLNSKVVVLNSIIDMNELKEKVTETCKELNLL